MPSSEGSPPRGKSYHPEAPASGLLCGVCVTIRFSVQALPTIELPPAIMGCRGRQPLRTGTHCQPTMLSWLPLWGRQVGGDAHIAPRAGTADKFRAVEDASPYEQLRTALQRLSLRGGRSPTWQSVSRCRHCRPYRCRCRAVRPLTAAYRH